jgi:hypothetical protein
MDSIDFMLNRRKDHWHYRRAPRFFLKQNDDLVSKALACHYQMASQPAVSRNAF